MSGGTLHPEYCYYMVNQFADELENKIENNEREDEYGYASRFDEKTLEILKNKLPLIRKISKVMKEIDYLYSGDHGEDTFQRIMERLESES